MIFLVVEGRRKRVIFGASSLTLIAIGLLMICLV